MKTITLAVVLGLSLVTLSCRTEKEVVENQNTDVPNVVNEPLPTDEPESERLVGVVEVVDDCGAIIRVVQGDVERSYLPNNLEEKFRVPGMKLRFSYQMVDEKLKGDCGFYQQISVTDVTILR